MFKIFSIFHGIGGVKMVRIFDVANWFILRGADEENAITPLKIQKLCYYAKAWHKVWDDEELFKENFEAWVHGPANPELFRKYKSQGYNLLKPECDIKEDTFKKNEIETLEGIWECYGKYTGKYLEKLTHDEDPWLIARGNLQPGDSSTNIISLDSMNEFYSKYE